MRSIPRSAVLLSIAAASPALLAGAEPSRPAGPARAIEEIPGKSALLARGGITPAVAIGADEAIHAVVFDRASRNVLLLASRDGGKSFSPPVTAIDTGGRGEAGMQRGPRVGVDGKGRVFVSTCLKNPEKGPWGADVWIAASTDGGRSFGKPVRVNDVPGSAPEMYQALSATASGSAHLAWLDLRRAPEMKQVVYAARVELGPGGPVAGRNVEVYASPSGTVCECCDVGIAADSRGDVAIAFRNSLDDGTRDAFVAVSRDGGATFGRAAKVGRGSWKAPG